jgi:TM2 domain-containing membrane protein YozV
MVHPTHTARSSDTCFGIFGFTGSHRFYYGKPISDAIWLFTCGLLLIGWIVDLILIPSMDRQADRRFVAGQSTIRSPGSCLRFLASWESTDFTLGSGGLVCCIC